jgi:HEAT repeat protein
MAGQLSQWLGEFNRIPPDRPAPEAEEAIRGIGERALPFLLSSIWATELNEVSRVRIWINQTFTRTYRSRIDLCAPSWRALSILGPRADAAIPEIVKHAADGPFEGRAMIALAVLGTNSIPALTALCGHSNADVRVSAAFVLAKTKVEMRGVESFLAQSPFSEQPMLAYNIKKGLEDMSPLVENLKHDVPAVRQATIEAIGSVPELLRASAPDLRNSLKDPDRQVREIARRFVESDASDAPATPSSKE